MTNKVLEWKNNGETIKRRIGEEIRINLSIDTPGGHWRAEPVVGGAISSHQLVWQSGRDLSFGYDACSAGQSTIQILYRVGTVIEKVFTVKVQVVPQPVPPPIKSVYVVEEITSRQVGDSRENEYETSKERLGIACSQEGVEDLIVRKRPGVVVQWRQDGSSARVEIQRLSRDSNREVYIQVTREPLHW